MLHDVSDELSSSAVVSDKEHRFSPKDSRVLFLFVRMIHNSIITYEG